MIFDSNGDADQLVYKTKSGNDGKIGFGSSVANPKTDSSFGDGCLVAYQLGFID